MIKTGDSYTKGNIEKRKKSKNNFCLSDKGQKFKIVSCGVPRENQYFLKPNGKKGCYDICFMQQEHGHYTSHGYLIIEFWE